MVVFPSFFVTDRLATSVPSVAEAVPLLLVGSGSGVGLETTAVFVSTSGPVYPLGTTKLTVMLRVSPGFIVPRLQGSPVGHSGLDGDPSPGGGDSVTVTLLAVDGPRLTMLSVNESGWPRVAVGSGAIFDRARSADAAIAVSSVDVLFPGSGSVVPAGGVTVAVLVKVPLAVGATVPVALKTTPAPPGRLTVVAMLPVPLAAPQLPTPATLGWQVQVTFCSVGGKVSATGAPTTSLGPWLVTAMV